MNHGSNHLYPGESGELADWLTNHELQRQTHRRREPFVLRSSTYKTTFTFGPKKMKRRCAREQISSPSSVFVFLVVVNAASRLFKVTVVVCLWQRYSTSHDVKWDHDWPAIPSLAGPPSAS